MEGNNNVIACSKCGNSDPATLFLEERGTMNIYNIIDVNGPTIFAGFSGATTSAHSSFWIRCYLCKHAEELPRDRVRTTGTLPEANEF